jgi:hypothetical protein
MRILLAIAPSIDPSALEIIVLAAPSDYHVAPEPSEYVVFRFQACT